MLVFIALIGFLEKARRRDGSTTRTARRGGDSIPPLFDQGERTTTDTDTDNDLSLPMIIANSQSTFDELKVAVVRGDANIPHLVVAALHSLTRVYDYVGVRLHFPETYRHVC